MELLQTTEHSDALNEFLRSAVNALMADIESLHSSLRRRKLPEGVTVVSVDVAEASITSELTRITETIEIRRTDIVNAEFGAFHEILSMLAESHSRQLMTTMIKQIDVSTEAVGNSVDAGGAPLTWDVLLQTYDKVDWHIDEFERAELPSILASPTAASAIEDLGEVPPWVRVRLALIALRKENGHVSRRRSRRIR